MLPGKFRFSSQFNRLFFLYISTAKPSGLVRVYIEIKINGDKQTRNLVSFNPASFDVSETYEGDVQS